jgi:Tfp pilus assembly protein PilO
MFKKLSRRDRIALGAGVGAATLFILLNYGAFPLLEGLGTSAEVIQQKEVEVRRDQRLLAEANLEKTHLSAAQERLKGLEAGLLESSSPSLANAEWQRLVGQLADSKGIEVGSREVLRVQELGAGYSLVTGRVQFRCRLDQLVDFLAALASLPRLLSVRDIDVVSPQGDPKQRLLLQLTIGVATRTVKQSGDETAAH